MAFCYCRIRVNILCGGVGGLHWLLAYGEDVGTGKWTVSKVRCSGAGHGNETTPSPWERERQLLLPGEVLMAGKDALSWVALGVLGTHIYDCVVLSLRSRSLYNSRSFAIKLILQPLLTTYLSIHNIAAPSEVQTTVRKRLVSDECREPRRAIPSLWFSLATMLWMISRR